MIFQKKQTSQCHSRPRPGIWLHLCSFVFFMFFLTACTSGLEEDYEDMYGYMVDDGSDVILSSSQDQPSSSSVKSSSSIASSSSIKDGYDAVAQTLTDSRDGQVYKTVTIGTQTWMAENLNYAYKGVKYSYSSYTSDSTSWCYGNVASNCYKYGRLYTWSAVMDSAAQFSENAGTECGYGESCTPNSPHRGICPQGWHVPTNEEYSTLYTYIGGSSTAGMLLKSTSGWYNGGNGSDKYGFSVLPAGYMSGNGSFYDEGYYAYLWTASEGSVGCAWGRYFYYGNGDADPYDEFKYVGRSLRCLKDSSLTSGEATSSSSVASSSSVKSSSSVGSSSSVVSSSSVASSSSIKYGTLTDSRDGQVYKTVTIGTQTWMAENLNYSTSGSYCYDDNASNCDKYGRLYVWSAAMNACPSGWHLPDDDEWNTLRTAVGGTGTAGTKLKSKSGWYNNGNGTDSFGFAVLPAGYRSNDGIFFTVGNFAHFWSSTEFNSNNAYYWEFSYSIDYVDRYNYGKSGGFSVRCLRDSDEGSEASSSSSQAQPTSSSSEVIPSSSSSVIPGTDPGSSSSSAKSSSSIASSSSDMSSSSSVNPGTDPESSSSLAKSCSSVGSSSSEKSSSSVASSSSVNDGSKYDASAKTLTDLRDGQVYKTVAIGTQTWMAENLNYAYKGVKFNYDGYTSDSTSWCYGNVASNCYKYGRLYTWSAVMDSAAQFSVNVGTKCGYGKTCTPNTPHRGICPEGWHVPTNEEYSTLYTYIGGTSTAGSLLKSTSGWNNSGNGSDKYGFSVLPAGDRYFDGDFFNEGYYAYLWSASEYYSYRAWDQNFSYDGDVADRNNYSKGYGQSLRCLKDSF